MGSLRNDFPLHQNFRENICLCLDKGEPWTSWFAEKFPQPRTTIKDWDKYLEMAISLHKSSKDKFLAVTGYKFIGEDEHQRYSKLLLRAREIVMSAYQAAIELYAQLRPADLAIQHLNNAELTVYLDQSLTQDKQADAFQTFLEELAIIFNRESGENIDRESNGGREFLSHHLDKIQSKLISSHLNHLIFLLARLPDSDAYARALLDAYHELRYKGHNPSLSVHNVLLDNKYQIYHRDVNFVRVARRSAKRIDMVIERHAELRRDQIVKEIKDYLRSEYRRVLHPEWVYDESGELPPSATSFRGVYLARITTLINRLDKIKPTSNMEQRAAILLRAVLSSAAKDIRYRSDEDDMFNHNLHLLIENDAQTNLTFFYREVLSLAKAIVSNDDADVLELDTPIQLIIAFGSPCDNLGLHPEQYPVMEANYLAHYGKFILKLSDDVIRQIEDDAERFRTDAKQVIIITENCNATFVGVDNDRLAHLAATTISGIKSFIRKEIHGVKKRRILDFGGTLPSSDQTLLKTWCKNRIWIVHFDDSSKSMPKAATFLERLYRFLGLSPQRNIVYVGFPDSPQLLAKRSAEFLIRSASNTASVHYWPATGFPDVLKDLPVTYFNLISFCLRYPHKLSILMRRIQKRADTMTELKQIPTQLPIEREMVEAVYREQLKERERIDFDQIFSRVAAQLYPHKVDAALTQTQQNVVRSYIALFESLKSLADLGNEIRRDR